MSEQVADSVIDAARRGGGTILKFGTDSVLWGRLVDKEHVIVDIEECSPFGVKGFCTNYITVTNARGSYVTEVDHSVGQELIRSCWDDTT